MYTVRFYSDGKKKLGLTFCGLCMPLDMTKETVVELGNCLIFSDATAKMFLVNDHIKYDIIITKADE